MADLPAWPEIEGHALRDLHAARSAMSGARDWLRSDWSPPGSELTYGQARARSEALRLVGEAQALIDQAKGALGG